MNYYLITYVDAQWLNHYETIAIKSTPTEWIMGSYKKGQVSIIWSCIINKEEYDILKKEGY